MISYLRYVMLVLLLGVVCYGVFNATPPPRIMGMSDKAGHLLAFASLSMYGLLALPRRLLGWFIGAVLVLAVGSEFVQDWLLPHRQFAVFDLLANLAGITVALGVWLVANFLKRATV